MRGNHKFWLLIFIVCAIYLNYISFFTGIDYSLNTTTDLQQKRAILTCLLDVIFGICFIMYFL